MDLNKMIAELQAERERLTQAIEVLERLYTGNPTTRRGRPTAPPKKEVESDESGQEEPVDAE